MLCRRLGTVDFESTFDGMKAFTASRTPDTEDEIWLLQHPPVYTQGLSGKPEHVLDPGEVPIIQIDRGGQVTYHGPGQWVAYVLYDLRRANVNVRQLVTLLESAVVEVLGEWGIKARGDPDARGVYVHGCKIAALGLKVSKGRSYHGLSLNVDMDLSPFRGINPCGYEGLEVTSIATLMGSDCPTMDEVGEVLLRHLKALLPGPD
jgi:lipoyl(octanoyl) transferase